MIRWKSLFKKIPNKVNVNGTDYEVVWTDGFPKDPGQLGESRFGEQSQILISTKQPPKEAVHTLFHELIHVFSYEYDVDMTEKQVMQMEKSLKDWIKNGIIFSSSAPRKPSKRKRCK